MARGDVFWVNIPYPRGTAGREQAGQRPAIAVQSDNASRLPTIMVVPTTTKVAALRFPYTIEVIPSETNGFIKTSILLVFQLRAIDKERIIEQVGKLEQEYLDQLDRELKSLLDLT